MDILDQIAETEAALSAVIEGRGTMEEARSAVEALEVSQPTEPYAHEFIEDPAERLIYETYRCLKLALVSLEGDQQALAKSYLKVARIKTNRAQAEGP